MVGCQCRRQNHRGYALEDRVQFEHATQGVSFVERGDRSEGIGDGWCGLFFWVGVGFVVTYRG
jgi:hypothetical protein